MVETLLNNFDVIADAPNGVQNIRELILQLAVRGKLVPQDPAEQSALAANHTAAMGVEDAPYAVPRSWHWVRLGSVMNLVNGRAFKPADWSASGVPIIRIQNLNNVAASFNYCSFDVPDKFYVHDEDLLLSWSGTPGTSFGAFVWRRGRAVLNQHIFRCELTPGLYLNDFARLAINARLDELIAQAHGGVGLQHVTKGKLDKLPIVLPPLAEQRRIVAKVDELMALCSQLDTRQRQRGGLCARANNSALHHLATARDAEVASQGGRISEHFALLYDTPERVAELRHVILQLAVRGKLVPQDSEREPVGSDARQEDGQCDCARLPFELPRGWTCASLSQLGVFVGGGTPSKSDSRFWNGRIPWVSPKDMKQDRVRETIDYINELALAHSSVRLISPGSLLMVVRGMILAKAFPVAIADCPVTVNQDMKALTLHDPRLADYLLLALQAWESRVLAAVERSTHGTCRLESSTIANLVVPLPPLDEQRRIVAKVKNLMAACDSLEASINRAREKATHCSASLCFHLGAA